MKNKFKKIAAILMTLIVLLSTMSFTIHQRYCNDNLVATTLFSKSQSCEIEKEKTCCLISKSCCEHKQLVLDGQNEIRISSVVKLSLKNQFLTLDLPNPHLQNLKIWPLQVNAKIEYAPPNLVEEKQSIHQVFII